MKQRNSVTGQYCRPLYELILHDFNNLAFQVVTYSEDKSDLEKQAENLNNLFIQAAKDQQFKAEVYESKT